MATKAQIQALIDTKMASGAPVLDLITHRDILHENASNLLDVIYPDVIKETNSQGNLITLVQDPAALYTIEIVKQGRKVYMSGRIIPQTFISTFAVITAGEFSAKTSSFTYGMAWEQGTGIIKNAGVSENAGQTFIKFKGALLASNLYNFFIHYYTEN